MTDRRKLADHYFVIPGTIRLSPSALAFARDFAAQFKGNTIVSFEYGFERTLRGPEGQVIDLGDGFDLGLYRRSQVPREVVHRESGFEYAIQVPPWIFKASNDRVIDVEGREPPKLVLR